MARVFDQAFSITIGEEGGYTVELTDKGNWTGGHVGQGALRGTKYGISAARYPDIDIAGLTLERAQIIYERDFWPAVYDKLPPALAALTFDAAVNSNPETAAKWLQAALGVVQDGQIGPVTLTAAAKADVTETAVHMLAKRILFMMGLSEWVSFRDGWTVRLFDLLPKALAVTP